MPVIINTALQEGSFEVYDDEVHIRAPQTNNFGLYAKGPVYICADINVTGKGGAGGSGGGGGGGVAGGVTGTGGAGGLPQCFASRNRIDGDVVLHSGNPGSGQPGGSGGVGVYSDGAELFNTGGAGGTGGGSNARGQPGCFGNKNFTSTIAAQITADNFFEAWQRLPLGSGGGGGGGRPGINSNQSCTIARDPVLGSSPSSTPEPAPSLGALARGGWGGGGGTNAGGKVLIISDQDVHVRAKILAKGATGDRSTSSARDGTAPSLRCSRSIASGTFNYTVVVVNTDTGPVICCSPGDPDGNDAVGRAFVQNLVNSGWIYLGWASPDGGQRLYCTHPTCGVVFYPAKCTVSCGVLGRCHYWLACFQFITYRNDPRTCPCFRATDCYWREGGNGGKGGDTNFPLSSGELHGGLGSGGAVFLASRYGGIYNCNTIDVSNECLATLGANSATQGSVTLMYAVTADNTDGTVIPPPTQYWIPYNLRGNAFWF
jgi:hypothetical protein